ncbi:MAG: baseplate J/gp47 family protein [Gammaproteobacteria bacterium]
MPLQLPDLDDRKYDDLVEEAIALIPRYAPGWTNYNASDPGITLIELFAYFAEMLIFRLDRIGREHKIGFLRLLAGPDQTHDEALENCSIEEIEDRIRKAILNLKQPQRAVTREDYEYLARQSAKRLCGEQPVRAFCVTGKNLAAGGAFESLDHPGHVSLIVVVDRERISIPYDELLRKVGDDLESKRLLTTRLHVLNPSYLWIALRLVIQPRQDACWESVRQSAQARLERFGSPFAEEGADRMGWPFGRNLYLSEIYDVLEQVPGIDHVDRVIVQAMSLVESELDSERSVVGVQIGLSSTAGIDCRLGTKCSGPERIITDGAGRMAGIRLQPHELIKIVIREQDIERPESARQPGKRTGGG